MPTNLPLRIPIGAVAAALSEDARAAAAAAHTGGFGGLQFDMTGGLDLVALSLSGRRDFLRMLREQDQQLIGLRADVGPKGLGDGADLDRLLWRMDQILEIAAGLQAPLVCLELTTLGKPEHVDTALGELGRVADRHGVIIALRCELSPMAGLHRALAMAACPWFGVDLDPAALLHDEWSMARVFEAMAGEIRHVRGRDALLGENRRARPMPIGKGSVNWEELLRLLEESGYQGWITIDPMELNDRRGGAAAGLKYLRAG